MLTASLLLTAIATVAIPRTRREGSERADVPEHGEVAILAAGTVVGHQPE